METLKQKPWLLGLLALLLVLRFIAVPIIEWQNQTHGELQLQQKRLDKAESAIVNQAELTPQIAPLAEAVTAYQAALFAQAPEAEFKLSAQQQVEQLLAKHKLTASGIGWLTQRPMPEAGLVRYQMQLRVEGAGVRLPAMLAELESGAKRIEVSELDINVSRQGRESMGRVNGRMLLNFYMLDKSAQAEQGGAA